jgi:hypothetical protein
MLRVGGSALLKRPGFDNRLQQPPSIHLNRFQREARDDFRAP